MKQGTNAAIMRKRNEKTILSLINARPVSRAEIAKLTGLTRAAVTIIIDELISKGYILEEPTMQATVGRQPVMLSFNGKDIYSVGINIMRNTFCVGISDLNGNVLLEESYPILPPKGFFGVIREIIENQIAKTGIDREKIYGIGVVSPGPVDAKAQKILNPPNFNVWHNVSVADEMKKLGYEVFLANVSNASALAEMYFGPAKGINNFMTILVDEGIGSGIVLNNQLFGGISELGHTSICYDGVLCECGNRGCLEKYAAIPMILKGTGFHSWKEVIDSDNTALIEKEAEYLSTAITSANNLFDLDMVILSGDLRYHPAKINALISAFVNRRRLQNKALQICAGQVTSKSLIASSVIVHEFFS
ncbi:MAG: ROK family transcriptional regulator [Lachnospiraceae bacterium]|nr:ROK family transcriptional regulator [Lachnospiraceae bacterium]MBQ8199098.1 ROK family transcriptional regulator [Lachnospiraceae bacterium]